MYLSQVLSPPKAILVQLGRICNTFLWDQNLENRRIHWSSWDKVCFLVEEGGLDFRTFEDMSRAFACKLWWKLRQRDSTWADFMQEKYLRGLPPLSISYPRPTALWRRLEEIRQLVEENIRWSLGKGFVDIWRDRWLFYEPLCIILDRPNSPHFLVSEFYAGDA